MRRGIVLLSGAALFCAVGCASRHTEERTNLASQSAEVRSKFENTSDPPISADTHFAAAQLAESQNNMPTAIKQYDEALKLNPKHTQSMYRLAMIHTEHKQYPKAIE